MFNTFKGFIYNSTIFRHIFHMILKMSENICFNKILSIYVGDKILKSLILISGNFFVNFGGSLKFKLSVISNLEVILYIH